MESTSDVAIVTGGSRGAGRAIARALGGQGYAVVVVYLRDQREAEATVEAIVAEGGAALAVRADVTDDLDVERLFDETTAVFGAVAAELGARDITVNGLAPGLESPGADHTLDELIALLDRWRATIER